MNTLTKVWSLSTEEQKNDVNAWGKSWKPTQIYPVAPVSLPPLPLLKYLRKPWKTDLFFFPLADCVSSLLTVTVIVLFP